MGDKIKKFTNVYVKNLPDDMNDDQLTEMFTKYGPVTSAKVMTNDDGKHKGFGFVSYESPDAAEKAVDELNGTEVMVSVAGYYLSLWLTGCAVGVKSMR